MNNILTVIKKELTRVFKDRALIIALLMPGLLIYAMYSIMGSAMMGAEEDAQNATYSVAVYGMPAEVGAVFDLAGIDNVEFKSFDIADLDDKKQQVKDGELDMVLVFSSQFMTDINAGNAGKVDIIYNPAESQSSYAFEVVSSGLDVFRMVVLADRGDNLAVEGTVEQVFDEQAVMAGVIANMIPFLMITFLFSGCMSLAPDSIAGEKERGTIATILITPIKRSELAIGKIVALGAMAIISAFSSFLGLMLALPKIMGDSMVTYGALEYVLILFVLVATVLLIIGVMAILSSLAKTVKEAGMYIMPFMFLSMLVGLGSFLGEGAMTSPMFYFIPLFNTVQSLTAIFSFTISPLNLLICMGSNLIYAGVAVFVLTKLFNNEKVMFSK